MVALAITPSEVKLAAAGVSKVRNIIRESVITTEDVDAGELIDLKSTPGKAKLSDPALAATADVGGMAINSAAAGQPVDVLESGVIEVGASASIGIGVPYFASPTPGKVAPLADIVNPNVISFVGVGLAGNLMQFNPQFSGQVVPV